MIELVLTLAAGLGGYLLARGFVRRRLRFVDAAQSRFAPYIAGIVAGLAILPLALLPLVSGITAVVFGVGAALGTASAVRIIRRADGELRRLTP
ncbi:MAG: hypothetical protein H0V43_01395 [Gemmatimonadales bacterium]|nr:hypothetical protein [Gemmatimonadales bacterium]MBA3553956.1 hypothetical protein [Gemmatimonadales bacterium]